MNKQRKHLNKQLFLGGLLIIALIVGVAILWLDHHDQKNVNLAAKSTQPAVKGSTSKPTPHNATAHNTTGQGGVIDHNGQTITNLPPSSQWVSATSGAITLQQPSAAATVRSGDTLSGLATVSNVQFILTDDAVGLIAQGNLSVVNGKFSGTLQFTPHAGTGKLKVYYPNPTNGAEEDIIEIDVTFNT